MTYIDSCKFLLKFDDINLTESISTTLMVPDSNRSEYASVNNQSVELLTGGLGYVMKGDQYLKQEDFSGNGFYINVREEMIMGFWLYPVNPGLVHNPANGVTESIQMPLIDIYPYSEISNPILTIKEKTVDDENNFMVVEISNGIDPSNVDMYRISTSTYSVGFWHYFWIVYSGIDGTVKIYVDGSLQSPIKGDIVNANRFSGYIPSIIDANFVDFYINRGASAFAFNIAGNYGYIDDVVILNTVSNSEERLQRSINFSIDYVVDEAYVDLEKKSYGLIFDDPSTIRVNAFVDDMSFVFLARNDGKILRGSPLFWEVRKTFSDKEEERLYEEIIIGGETSDAATTLDDDGDTTGFLKIKKSILKL